MQTGTVVPIKIEDEMRSSYLDYAMSVIVSRALPDVRDGLKPVHRRILYAMNDLGLRHNSAYKKSARIVGEVLGKYHPHGDTSVYDAMVRMAQDFSMRYRLVDGQGNFGSVDNDPPAAMRYTEARMTAIAEEMLADIDKETVSFTPNFDDSLKEPTVLPTRLPNLLVTGSSGIAVGMTTNIPPHNLGEICDAIAYLVDSPEATVDDLLPLVKGPDFPTGGIIYGREGIRNAYTTGHGRIVIRAKAKIEELPKVGRHRIVVTELPYQVNKAALVERIADLVRNRRLEGISDLRDESDREGMRIVIELKKGGHVIQVLNNLYKHTAMQSAFFVNMLALVDRQPRVISLKAALQHYINFRREVITKRSKFDLGKAKDRAHILEGLKTALEHLEEVIALIEKSQSAESARTNLMRNFHLSQVQAQAILDMQLRRLAALERKKLTDEYAEMLKTIAYLEDLLANPKKIDFLIKEEVIDLKARYGDERRTLLREAEIREFQVEDLVPHENVVVTLSNKGYVKRIPLDTYRLQRRGGKGVKGVVNREEEMAQHLVIADTHHTLLFFTNRGRVFRLKCHEISADTSRQAKGIPIINLIPVDQGEQATAIVAVESFDRDDFMVMATRRGEIKKTELERFASVRRNGLIAMNLKRGDELISTKLAHAGDEVIMVTENGKAIKFAVDTLRTASRMSGGVRGIRLTEGDKLVAMDLVPPDTYLLVVSTHGFGKRTPLRSYPLHRRGGSGVLTFRVNPKAGKVAAAAVVDSTCPELVIISSEGKLIRMPLGSLPAQGRHTQGVGVIKLKEGVEVASIACRLRPEEEKQEALKRERKSPKVTAPKSSPQAPEKGQQPPLFS